MMVQNTVECVESNKLNPGVVSLIHSCQSQDTKMLHICEFKHKIKNNNYYDIGGTYSGSESDLWFYMTTSTFSEKGHLLNLFFCHQKVGNVSVTLSLNGVNSSHIFTSSKPNENYHLKTICVTKELIASTNDDVLSIPVIVEIEPTQLVNPEVIRKMKIQNSIGEKLLKQKNTDVILESKSHKQYPVHKIVLCAHSPVLRELVKNSSKSSQFLDISDEDMDLLVEFLYTGSIKDINKIDCMRIQELACKFELSNLFLLAQHLICEKITIENAIDIAVLAKKYNLDELWTKVCSFVQQNPAVLATESWKSLNDVELTKQLCAALVK